MKKIIQTLFPTTIVGYKNENHVSINSKLLDLISKEEFFTSNYNNSQRSGYGPDQTKDYHLQNRKEYSQFFSWVQSCLDDYKESFKLHTEGLKISLSWINRGNQYTEHRSHFHQNSYISGVYYISDQPSPTYFECPVTVKRTGIFVMSDLDYNTWVCPATAGQLVLFPSWLGHYTKPQPFDGVRYTLSLNVMPVGLTNPNSLIEHIY